MGSTILLADDSLTIQKVVELTFSDTDHEVVAVSSGEELMQRLPDTKPDLVICDILMPGTDGYEVCQRIKSSPASLHIPVILLTGTFEPFDRERALAAGCSEIITKPFEARKLVETVERLLAGDTSAPRAYDRPGPTPVATPGRFQGAVAPPPAAQPEEGFATRLAPPDHTPTDAAGQADNDGLEFTATGFAEMEGAGEAEPAPAPAPTDDGLVYETGEPAADDSGFDDAFGDDFAGDEEFEDEAAVATDEPFSSNEVTADFPPPAATDDEPFAAEAAAAELPTPDAPTTAPPRFEDADITSGDTWPDMTESAGDVGDAFEQVDVEAEAEAEIATMPVPAAVSEAAAFDLPADSHDAEDGADTAPIVEPQPQSPPPPPSAPAPAQVVATAAASAALSDEDVDRIARRLLELAADRIEQIAWDVVPDMAEIVVRERIRELETAADADA